MSLFKGQRGNEAAFIRICGINTADISQHQQLFCLQRTGNFTGSNICVNVIGFTLVTDAGRSNYRNITAVQQAVNQIGVDLFNAADKTDIYQVNLTVFINISQIFLAFSRLASLPLRPTALPPKAFRRPTRSVLILPTSAISAIAADSASVTRRPPTNSLFLPACSS